MALGFAKAASAYQARLQEELSAAAGVRESLRYELTSYEPCYAS